MYNSFIDLCCVFFQVLQLDNVEVLLKLPAFLCDATFSFTHIGPLCYHLERAVNVKSKETFTDKYLSQSWPDGCIGNVVVDEETPAILTFSMKSFLFLISVQFKK